MSDKRLNEERFAEEHPDEHLRRRDFLARTASLAGAAGLAGAIPLETLMHGAAQAQASVLPSPSNMPIDTFVVLMMENRSFDHYFGWHPTADATNQLTYPDEQGAPHPTHHLAPDFQGCAFGDPNHGWQGGRTEYHRGKLDGFLTTNDEYAIGYYLEQDLPFIPSLADAFTLYDRYFTSILTGTYPNRHYMWGAQCGGQKSNVIPADSSLGDHWETIFDRAQGQGISVGYYPIDLPVAALYGDRAIPWVRSPGRFFVDAAAGTLPNICFVDPPFTDGGGGDGLSGDEHPHGDIRIGQSYMAEIVHAFLDSPQWQRGAMFVNYDEWGGFFDHVTPRRVPDDLESPHLWNDFGITGFRIPGVALSPYARRGVVSHQFTTHESILKLIAYRFRLGFLNKRHRYATNIGRTFDWANPNFEIPALPNPLPPVTTACSLQSRKARRASASSEPEVEINGPEFLAYLDRLGYEHPPLRAENMFQDPRKIERMKQLLGQ